MYKRDLSISKKYDEKSLNTKLLDNKEKKPNGEQDNKI